MVTNLRETASSCCWSVGSQGVGDQNIEGSWLVGQPSIRGNEEGTCGLSGATASTCGGTGCTVLIWGLHQTKVQMLSTWPHVCTCVQVWKRWADQMRTYRKSQRRVDLEPIS